MKKVVYDLEVLASCFTYTDININTLEITQFILHKDNFELDSLVSYLDTVTHQVGFNNLTFDYPIIHYILNRYKSWKWQLDRSITYQDIIKHIYSEAQRIIDVQNQKIFTKSVAIRESECKIHQLDLFKIWHYNNKARSTSLKALEISMNFPNVMEMEVDHKRTNIKIEEVEGILEYNKNDVLATFEFYKLSIEKIKLRQEIRAKYNISCINFNNGKIGEQLILKLYCEKTGSNFWDIKNLRTFRASINLAECVPKIVSFKTKEFNNILNWFNTTTITETKGSIDKSLVYKRLKYEYGTGGLHACIKAGIYISDNEYIIKTADVSSLYPNLPIKLGFTIEHLGSTFLEIYRDSIVSVRMAEKAKPKEQQDKTIIDGFKEASNIPYGKSNDKDSFLYDPLYSMKTTIAGQLLLSMLAESLSNIPDSQILMVNTDGLEIRIPRKYETIYNNLCKSWELLTNLTLEFDEYEKMCIRDVNNYSAKTISGKVKNKGAFEVDKVIGNEPAYHKDNSFRIVPLALQEYFYNNISLEQTIKNHFNTKYSDIKNNGIYDFCGRQKFTQDSHGEIHEIAYDKNKNPYTKTIKQQKNVRYFISNDGKNFIKIYLKGSFELINKGYLVTIFNKFEDKKVEDYKINFEFYIKEANKIIDILKPKQYQLL